MKRNFFYHLVLTAIAVFSLSAATASPSEALLRLFSRTFPDAKYIRWNEEGGYHIVSFTRNESQCRIWYDNEGALVYSLRYCQESELPMKVLLAVKKRYHDRRIDGVIEVTNRNGVNYELTLSDERKWYVVNATAYGDVSLKYSFRKQD